MKKSFITSSLLGAAGLAAMLVTTTTFAAPLGDDFTYQGRLYERGLPVNGYYDFRFKKHEMAEGGGALGGECVVNRLLVTNGLFTAQVNMGASFFGDLLWLAIEVKTNTAPDGAFALLNPRQPLTATPNAHYARLANGAITARFVDNNGVLNHSIQDNAVTAGKIAPGQVVKSLNGLRDAVTLAAGANTTISSAEGAITIASTGPGADWHLGGNLGTDPTVNFLGTADDQSLAFRVNNETVMRYQPHPFGPGVLGGHPLNYIDPGAGGAVIAGGGTALLPNRVLNDFGTVGGGKGNVVGARESTVAGGEQNSISAAASWSFIGGGIGHLNDANYTTIGGGFGNMALAQDAVVGGGSENAATQGQATVGGGIGNVAGGGASTVSGGSGNDARAPFSTVGGGIGNEAAGQDAIVSGGSANRALAGQSTVGGGIANTASAPSATVSGGQQNSATGAGAVVPGGQDNVASGAGTLAAGTRANAMHDGSFAWADRQPGSFPTDRINQFAIRAQNGVMIEGRANVLDLRGDGAIRVAGAGVGTAGPVFTHRAAAANTSGAQTVIDHPHCNNRPGAILIVNYVFNPAGLPGTRNDKAVGLYYTGSRWAIYNLDGTAMPVGAAYNVFVVNP